MTSDRNNCLIKSRRNGTMYPLDVSLIIGKPQLCFLSKAVSEVSWLWHRKLAHMNFRYINKLVTGQLVWGLPILQFNYDTLCPVSECGKQTKESHPLIINSSIVEPLELIHIDLYGPSTVVNLHHKKYTLVIVADYTRFTWVLFLRLKSDTPQILINFLKEIELHIKLSVKRIRNDNVIEFTNQLLNSFLVLKWISDNCSTPYTTTKWSSGEEEWNVGRSC